VRRRGARRTARQRPGGGVHAGHEAASVEVARREVGNERVHAVLHVQQLRPHACRGRARRSARRGRRRTAAPGSHASLSSLPCPPHTLLFFPLPVRARPHCAGKSAASSAGPETGAGRERAGARWDPGRAAVADAVEQRVVQQALERDVGHHRRRQLLGVARQHHALGAAHLRARWLSCIPKDVVPLPDKIPCFSPRVLTSNIDASVHSFIRSGRPARLHSPPFTGFSVIGARLAREHRRLAPSSAPVASCRPPCVTGTGRACLANQTWC